MKRISVCVDVQTQHVRDLILACLAEDKTFEPSLGSAPAGAQLYIREVGGRLQEALAELAELRAHYPNLEIALTSAASDSSTLLCCMDAGIRYFLPQPVHPKDIRAVLRRYLDRQSSEAPPPKRALVIGVIGAKGGVGATTLAVNLALAYQQNLPEGGVLLLDANIPHGDAGLFLDLTPQLDLATIVADISRLDTVLLESAMASHSSGLRYLATVRQYEDLPLSTPESMSHVLSLAQGMFEVIVIDLGTYYGRVTMKFLELADVFLLVTEPALSCLHNAASFTGYASQRSPGLAEKILVILNRVHDRAPYSIADMEKAIGRPFYWRLPNDYQTAGTAKEIGQPVVLGAPKSRLATAIRELAQSLLPQPGSGKRKRGLFGLRLFNRD